ncbi:hypothetical protein [Bifidobacterium sp. SO1]|uniref:hypothetical protein n=1 Tax=Bifidobacterium sp. SO1 TaxID=2809029 RepID=UPI001BDDA473|nr:hypothetical protein [Bifidobacterium sp. SO1]MBT1161270.1 hypothetical protein [Bifidobacterium sp. SO1]
MGEREQAKVTYKSGGIYTGPIVNEDADLCPLLGEENTGLYITDDDMRALDPNVVSIEPLDDPSYERITGRHDLREGDLIVTLIGNRYKVLATREGSDFVKCRTLEDPGSPFSLDVGEIRYVLRRKLQLPDKPGLWVDNEGAVWLAWNVEPDGLCVMKTEGAPSPMFNLRQAMLVCEADIEGYAPFHPGHVVLGEE